jgi:predicted transcriptional regulator
MKPHSITVRLGPDLKQRLHQSARKLDLSENNIAKQAVRAAVDFIEANNYRIELPLQMAAASGPIKSRVRRPKKVKGLDETERRHPKRKNRIPLLS